MSDTKRINVKFSTGLPGGTRAIFTHDGETWIAHPIHKYTRVVTVIDRMIGIYSRINDSMVRWINAWPDDAERVVAIMELTERGRVLQQELIIEKARGQTE